MLYSIFVYQTLLALFFLSIFNFSYAYLYQGVSGMYVFLLNLPIPMAERSKVQFCGRLLVGIAVSNPARAMDVCLL
jgi:hypothetical protein